MLPCFRAFYERVTVELESVYASERLLLLPSSCVLSHVSHSQAQPNTDRRRRSSLGCFWFGSRGVQGSRERQSLLTTANLSLFPSPLFPSPLFFYFRTKKTKAQDCERVKGDTKTLFSSRGKVCCCDGVCARRCDAWRRTGWIVSLPAIKSEMIMSFLGLSLSYDLNCSAFVCLTNASENVKTRSKRPEIENTCVRLFRLQNSYSWSCLQFSSSRLSSECST